MTPKEGGFLRYIALETWRFRSIDTRTKQNANTYDLISSASPRVPFHLQPDHSRGAREHRALLQNNWLIRLEDFQLARLSK